MGISGSLSILSFSGLWAGLLPGVGGVRYPGSWYLSPLISLSWLWGPWGQVPAGICASGHRGWSLPFPGPDPGREPGGLLRAQRRCLLRLSLERYVEGLQTPASPFLAPWHHGEEAWRAGGYRRSNPERFLESRVSGRQRQPRELGVGMRKEMCQKPQQ